MTITILPEGVGKDGVIYRAISGARRSEGQTAGEALDALTTQLNEEEAGTLVIVQNLRPDRFFTVQQKERLGELMTRWRSARNVNDTLPAEEEIEIEQLIDAELKAATSRALGASQELTQQPQADHEARLDEAKLERPLNQIIGSSAAMKDVLKLLEQVATTDTTLLLVGEPGVGKTLLARAVHSASRRADQPLIIVNCAALPEALEVELFGSEAGASRGAHRQIKGRLEFASEGTLVLDGVDKLTPDAQARVLRILQEGEFNRLGGSDSIKIDVRVIATTTRDLHAEALGGRFRHDLFYRLSVFPVTIPPLRHRREDIPVLVRHFVQKLGARMGKQFNDAPASIMLKLQEYDWPRNVDELENLIEWAVVFSPGGSLNLDPYEDPYGRRSPKKASVYVGTSSSLELEEAERLTRIHALTPPQTEDTRVSDQGRKRGGRAKLERADPDAPEKGA